MKGGGVLGVFVFGFWGRRRISSINVRDIMLLNVCKVLI